ncbi:sensor histidine kinase [Nonomuraea phyllanthi]|nr:sensor histidine kinase [Nonomuraea phyllanthi]
MRAPSGLAPAALRVGMIAVLVMAQVRENPAPGLTGTSLAITLMTAALAATLLTVLFASARRPARPRRPATTRRPRTLPRRLRPRRWVPAGLPVLPRSRQAPSPDRRGANDHDRRHDQQDTRQPDHQNDRQPGERHNPHPAEQDNQRPGQLDAQTAQQPDRQDSLGTPVAPEPPPRTRLIVGLPITMIALAVAVILSVTLSTLTEGSAAIAALLVCVSLAVTRLSLRHALPIGVLAVGGLIIAGQVVGNPARDLSLILSVCLIFLISYAAKQRKATRAAEAREAVLAERARIAREIHDILAHSLSAQLVHLEGAKLLLRADRAVEALERVTNARDLARSGLEEARRAVAALREDPPPLPVALRTLAEHFESTTDQACTLRISGSEHRLSPETELALVRTAQEALTNVRRHAPGSPASVELEFGRVWCELRVTNPASPEKGSPGGGYGLVGMRERAELLGGTLSAGDHDGGFLVHLKVPA